MSKKISITGIDARIKAVEGVKKVAEPIKSTMGPFGLNFLLEKGNKITNDGYLISAELCGTLEDEFERRGALVAHEASAKTNEMVGDATSTAWALTDAIIKEAIRFLPTKDTIKAKKKPSEIIQLIKQGKEEILKLLEPTIQKIENKEELIKSALVSVEDEEISKLLGEMQWELGPEGRIITEEVNDFESSIERVKGMKLDNGFSSTNMVTNPEKGSLELVDVPVLLTNYTFDVKEITDLKATVFSHLIANKKMCVLLVGRAFTQAAIQLCNQSLSSGFAIFPVNAPYVNQNQIMHDLEAILGGRYINTEEVPLSDTYVTDVGFARRVEAKQFGSIVTGHDDEKSGERITARVEKLTKELKAEQSEFGKRMLEERIAQLSNGFAILKIGSQSLTNRKRLKDKCDDAVNSVRLALKGGTVKGAGLAFKEISDQLSEDNILKRPIRSIYDQIISSAPEDFIIEDWVRDPFLTLKAALENACDFAGAFATTNGIITTKDKSEKCVEHESQE